MTIPRHVLENDPLYEFLFWNYTILFYNLCRMNIHTAQEHYAQTWMNKPTQEKEFQPLTPPNRPWGRGALW